MVKISGFKQRKTAEGKTFITLELQGDVELVQSTQTGKFYATSRHCSISSTFDEEEAKTLIGKHFPGRIVRENVEEYDYIVKETGEVIKLCHAYVYDPEEAVEMNMRQSPVPVLTEM